MVECGIRSTTGKQGRAVGIIEDTAAAQESPSIEVVEITSPDNNVLNIMPNDIIDLYSVGHETVTRTMCNTGAEVPFQHMLRLLGPQGEVVWVSALFDGCDMVSALCTSVFEKVKHRLGKWGKSTKRL